MGPHSWRELLARPRVRTLAVAGFVARLREAGTGLAIVLVARAHTGSYAAAGGAVAVYLLGAAVSRPLHGRLVDRRGPRALLVPSAVNAAALLALAGLVVLGAGEGLLDAGAAACGLSLPAISATLRAVWPRVATDHTEHAYALDTVLYELSLIVSPALVALLAGAASPAIALGFVALTGMAGTTVVAVVAPVVAGPRASTPADGAAVAPTAAPPEGALRSPVVLGLIAMAALTGLAEGSLTVLAPAYASGHGGGTLGGLLLSALAGGSLVGALLTAAVPARVPWRTRLLVAAAGLGLAYLALAAIPAGPGGVAALLALVGVALAPTLTTGFLALGREAPPAALTEAFTWASFGAAAASAGGQALAGRLVDGAGITTAFWEPAIAAGLALAVAAALHRTAPGPRRPRRSGSPG